MNTRYTIDDFLTQYHALDGWREEIQEAYDAANSGEGSYAEADESRADVNEVLADLCDYAAVLLQSIADGVHPNTIQR